MTAKTAKPKPAFITQADEALRKALAATPEKARPLPTDPAARRREVQRRGW